MRNEMEAVLKKEFRALAKETRKRLDFTQKEMAEALAMSETSYADIEKGVYMCGTLTAILLLMEHPCPEEFLQHLKQEFENLYEQEHLPV